MSESGKITIIANNIKGNASGQVRYDAKKISNTSGGIFTQNGKGSGVSHVDNTARKEAVGIKITKLEGPFDGQGKLVNKVRAGESYIFKATPSREPNAIEVPLLKWAFKPVDKELYQINDAGIHNKLVDKKIIITLTISTKSESAKVYAFFKKPDDNISVEIKLANVFHPYLIAKSEHRKGMNQHNTGTHHDMMSGDMTDAQIIALNPDTKKWIDIVNKEGYEGIKKLASEMEDLVTDFSMGDLEDVNVKLYKKFVGNIAGDFSDEVLTKAAKEHEHSDKFFSRIKENMIANLKKNPDFVFEQKLMPSLLKIETFKGSGVYRIDIPSPSYPDKYGGLGISINDTWGYDIKITRFQQNVQKRTFDAEFEIEIFDHYGLNSEDIDPKIKGGFLGPASFEGFLCWFILQHKCGYKPFYTILKMKQKILNEKY